MDRDYIKECTYPVQPPSYWGGLAKPQPTKEKKMMHFYIEEHDPWTVSLSTFNEHGYNTGEILCFDFGILAKGI